MEELAFAFDYAKLPAHWEGTTAFLLAVERVNLENLPFALVEYDSKYFVSSREEPDFGYFPLLEKGEYLLLLFKHENGAVFTTLRKDNLENREKYNLLSYYGPFLLVRRS